jgi:hypothetical protein
MRNLRKSNFDITGNSFFRVLKFNLLNKILPLGNYRSGTGLLPGLILLFLHWIGRPLFRILVQYEPPVHRLLQMMRRKQQKQDLHSESGDIL